MQVQIANTVTKTCRGGLFRSRLILTPRYNQHILSVQPQYNTKIKDKSKRVQMLLFTRCLKPRVEDGWN
jgi:hypothetical protein